MANKTQLICWNPVTRKYGRVESGNAIGRPAYYAVYDGMRKYHESFGGAYDELAKAGYEPNGFLDETGCRRYTMPLDELESLYKVMENFVADCTEREYKENAASISAVFTLLHKHINAETLK